jgi:ABC-type bacteriocin/lantibiotic exporter with double-glycine peptidase domain
VNSDFIKGLKKYWIEIGLCSFLINVCGLLVPIFSTLVYDKVVGNGNNETLWALTIGVVFIIAIEFALRILRGYAFEQITAASDVWAEHSLMERMLRARSDQTGSLGQLISRYRDHAGARDSLFSNYSIAAADIPFFGIFLLTMFWIGGPLVLVPLVVACPLLLGSFLVQRPVQLATTAFQLNSAKKTSLIAEYSAAREHIQTSNLHPRLAQIWSKVATHSALARGKSRFLQTLGQSWTGLCITLSSVMLLVAGVYRIESGAMSVGTLIACSLINLRAMAQLATISGMMVSWRELQRTQAELDLVLPKLSVDEGTDNKLIAHAGEVHIAGLQFRFNGRTSDALKDLSFDVAPGERIALVGRPGSGKSTLLKCIAGLLQAQAGTILVDGISVANLDIPRSLTYKPQEPVLFDGSVNDNMKMDAEVEPARKAAVLQLTGMSKAIRNGELSLDMQVGPGGAHLSGGQRQMLELARVLSAYSPIYLLDEPTAGVDADTEMQFANALNQLTRGKTVLMATHSRAVLEFVDRIIVIEQGVKAADGPQKSILC